MFTVRYMYAMRQNLRDTQSCFQTVFSLPHSASNAASWFRGPRHIGQWTLRLNSQVSKTPKEVTTSAQSTFHSLLQRQAHHIDPLWLSLVPTLWSEGVHKSRWQLSPSLPILFVCLVF